MKTLFSAALLLTASAAQAQFTTTGIATFNPSLQFLNLVPVSSSAPCGSSSYYGGAGWSTTNVNFNNSFVLQYKARFATYTSCTQAATDAGADGLVVVFGSNIANNSLNGPAGALGYYPGNGVNNAAAFTNSIGVEFDIFNNNASYNDPSAYPNHTVITRDGDPFNTLTPTVPINGSNASVEDATYHDYRVEWNCSDRRMRVYFDNALRLITDPLPYTTIFTNPASVRWGFTGGRGTSSSDHQIRNIVMTAGRSCSEGLARTATGDAVSDATHPLRVAQRVTVAPNPSTGWFELSLANGTIQSVNLYNMSGALVKKLAYNDVPAVTVDAHELPAGFYTAEITNAEGAVEHARISVVH